MNMAFKHHRHSLYAYKISLRLLLLANYSLLSTTADGPKEALTFGVYNSGIGLSPMHTWKVFPSEGVIKCAMMTSRWKSGFFSFSSGETPEEGSKCHVLQPQVVRLCSDFVKSEGFSTIWKLQSYTTNVKINQDGSIANEISEDCDPTGGDKGKESEDQNEGNTPKPEEKGTEQSTTEQVTKTTLQESSKIGTTTQVPATTRTSSQVSKTTQEIQIKGTEATSDQTTVNAKGETATDNNADTGNTDNVDGGEVTSNNEDGDGKGCNKSKGSDKGKGKGNCKD